MGADDSASSVTSRGRHNDPVPPVRNLVNLESVSKAFGERPLLAGVSTGIGAGERIGVVGRNGAGKSTLLAVMAGDEPVDAGRVSLASDAHLGLLRQNPPFDPATTILEAVVGSRATHEWAVEARVREVLVGLLGGFDDALLDRRLGDLSGGERRRVELARLLVADLDLLMLDEPTNHLDVEIVAWLAAYLKGRSNLALAVVTHDRWFLDEVCDRTWEVVDGNVEEYDGGYSAYVLSKAERTRQGAAAEARRNNLIRKELAWLRRGAPARTSKPKFRVDAANELITNEPPPRDSVELLSFANARLGKSVVELRDTSLAMGDKRALRPPDVEHRPGRPHRGARDRTAPARRRSCAWSSARCRRRRGGSSPARPSSPPTCPSTSRSSTRRGGCSSPSSTWPSGSTSARAAS